MVLTRTGFIAFLYPSYLPQHLILFFPLSALLRVEGQRVAMETAHFNDMAVTPLLAKLDTRTRERLTEAVRGLYTSVLERPVVNEITWYKGLTNTKESCLCKYTEITNIINLFIKVLCYLSRYFDKKIQYCRQILWP